MRTAVFLAIVLCISTTTAETRKKPLCEMCINVMQELDKVLEKGEDMAKALDDYCEGDCPDYLKQYCKKIDRSLKYIIEKLKDHSAPEKICDDIHLCVV